MGYLSLRISYCPTYRLHFELSVFVDNDRNKRGQTSRPVIRTQIQTSCNFEANIPNCNCLLGCICCWFDNVLLESSYKLMVCIYQTKQIWFGISLCLVTSIFCYTNIFITLRQNQVQAQVNVYQGQPSQIVSLNRARYRKTVTSALWVQLTLVVCYLPHGIVELLFLQRGPSSSLLVVRLFTVTLVFLNSTLNPILYCWKIREVRQAVKDTIRGLCYSWS